MALLWFWAGSLALSLLCSALLSVALALPVMAWADPLPAAGEAAQRGGGPADGVADRQGHENSPALMAAGGDEQQMLEEQRILGSARKALELRFHQLGQAKADFSDHVDNQKLVPQEAAARLVGIYEVMRPREAAAVFNVMDPHVLIAIAASMNIRKLSAVMAHMTPDRVNLISQYLVGVRHFRHPMLTLPVMISTSGTVPVNGGQAGPSEAEALEKMGDEEMARHGPLLPSRQ